ncbi:hypothetical protein WR25_20759 [Diploscapter pachys]|uniref:SGNH hydrolase-type esterase domain-containing protein n=1 Tax=Diploscapter pachys TaxID=2018661 RepID=A0A2A2LZJ3_9BILA|nr:hypothetical protein WR25_20759 [Diploscapter pachys]
MVSLSKKLILFCLCTLFLLNLLLAEAKSAQVDGNEWRGKYLGDVEVDYYEREKKTGKSGRKQPSLKQFVDRKLGDDDKRSDEDEEPEDDPEDNDKEDESDVSEERSIDVAGGDSVDALLKVNTANEVSSQQLPQLPSVIIDNSFNNRKTFSCPRIKTDLKTGTSIGDLSPEDIGIIAAMGGALATGIGLWPTADIEFRGASFPIGGDATIDGLVTVPNILREFNPRLLGVSHGMGTREQLPEHQLNVAQADAKTDNLPDQAKELVRRLKKLRDVDYTSEWVMVIVTIGTEELCLQCREPNYNALERAVDILNAGIPKAFLVFLGPLYVSYSHNQTMNVLKDRCDCLKKESDDFVKDLENSWRDAFNDLQAYVDETDYKRVTFGMISIPFLTITSRYPNSLFIKKRGFLLNRRGHNYATKWLWNRVIAGDKYNLSSAILSQDTYFCPSTGCPYFHTSANAKGCQLLSLSEAKEKELALGDGKVIKMPRRSRQRLYTIAGVIVVFSLFMVCVLGTFFYQKSKNGTRGRFEVAPEVHPVEIEINKEEERQNLLLASRANSTDEKTSLCVAPAPISRHNTFRITVTDESGQSPKTQRAWTSLGV